MLKKDTFYLSKFYAILCCFIFISALMVEASPTLDVEADLIQFDEQNKSVYTQGSSAVGYLGYVLNSGSFSYEYASGEVGVPHQFSISKNELTIHARDFQFNAKSQEGVAHDLACFIDDVQITGKRMTIEEDKIILHGATFTRCDPTKTHYLVSSEKMILFPKWGFIVFYSNSFHLPFLPFKLWFPTYFYGARSKLSQRLIPDIGSNQREGFYVKQSIGYFLNSQSTGTVDLGYLDRFGVTYGFNHEHALNERETLGLSAHSLGSDGYMGGLSYSRDFIPSDLEKTAGPDDIFSTFTQLGEEQRANFSMRVFYRELIHQSRVDHSPEIKFTVPSVEIADSKFKLSTTLGYAQIHEETIDEAHINSPKYQARLELNRKIALSDNLELEPFIETYEQWYSQNQYWHRQFLGLRVRDKWGAFHPRAAYIKVFREGQSPFKYVSDFQQQNDEVHLGFTSTYKTYEFKTDLAYDLKREKNRLWDVSIGFLLNCIYFDIGYRIVEEQYTFGFRL